MVPCAGELVGRDPFGDEVGLGRVVDALHTHVHTHLHTFTHIYTHVHTFTHTFGDEVGLGRVVDALGRGDEEMGRW